MRFTRSQQHIIHCTASGNIAEYDFELDGTHRYDLVRGHNKTTVRGCPKTYDTTVQESLEVTRITVRGTSCNITVRGLHKILTKALNSGDPTM